MHWGGLTLTSFFFTYFYYYYPFPFLLFDSRFSKSKKFRLLVQKPLLPFCFNSLHFDVVVLLFPCLLLPFCFFLTHTSKTLIACMRDSEAQQSPARHSTSRPELARETDGRRQTGGGGKNLKRRGQVPEPLLVFRKFSHFDSHKNKETPFWSRFLLTSTGSLFWLLALFFSYEVTLP